MVGWMGQLGHCGGSIKLLLRTQVTTLLEGIGESDIQLISRLLSYPAAPFN